MKSQMFILCLLIIGVLFFQPTHQYRSSKRELTEYDLTSFIVGTCSSDKNDLLIQNLCDQTLESALMGNFPFLTYYCKTLGVGMSYCHSINRQTITNQNTEAKRFAYRRLARSLIGDNKLHRKGQVMNRETDFTEKMIVSRCILSTEKSSLDNDQFCNRTLPAIQQGRYLIIRHICMYYPSTNNYCQLVRYYSTLYSDPLSKLSSPLPSLSSTHSPIQSNNPSFVSSSVVKPSDIDSIVDQQRINKQQEQQLSLSS